MVTQYDRVVKMPSCLYAIYHKSLSNLSNPRSAFEAVEKKNCLPPENSGNVMIYPCSKSSRKSLERVQGDYYALGPDKKRCSFQYNGKGDAFIETLKL